MESIWKILEKKGELRLTRQEPLKPGLCSICVPFEEDGCVAVDFEWDMTVVPGQKSPDILLVPDDPDMFICNYFKVISISNYDLDGTEYRVHITKEITDSFKEWIRGTGMINVDDWEV
jgi:hypothetical protein